MRSARVLNAAARNRAGSSRRIPSSPRLALGHGEEQETFSARLHPGFWCPPRLRKRDAETVSETNDWYFAMLRDDQRNEFFFDSMRGQVEGKHVLDVGAGCGLLSMMAARLGAAKVTSVESSPDMAALARENVKRNGYSDCIRVINSHSRDLVLPPDDLADFVVSETFGTLLLGEGALASFMDASRRLAKPGAVFLPASGAQCATVISSPTLASLSRVPPPDCVYGFDLSATDVLQDTASIQFTKDRGIRLNELKDLKVLSPTLRVGEIIFGSTEPSDIPLSSSYKFKACAGGETHAVVTTWVVWDGTSTSSRSMSTHWDASVGSPWGFYRDVQWGQGIQLLEAPQVSSSGRSRSAAAKSIIPRPLCVSEGDVLEFQARWSNPGRTAVQFSLKPSPAEC